VSSTRLAGRIRMKYICGASKTGPGSIGRSEFRRRLLCCGGVFQAARPDNRYFKDEADTEMSKTGSNGPLIHPWGARAAAAGACGYMGRVKSLCRGLKGAEKD
jgi:hypothetical protein